MSSKDAIIISNTIYNTLQKNFEFETSVNTNNREKYVEKIEFELKDTETIGAFADIVIQLSHHSYWDDCKFGLEIFVKSKQLKSYQDWEGFSHEPPRNELIPQAKLSEAIQQYLEESFRLKPIITITETLSPKIITSDYEQKFSRIIKEIIIEIKFDKYKVPQRSGGNEGDEYDVSKISEHILRNVKEVHDIVTYLVKLGAELKQNDLF